MKPDLAVMIEQLKRELRLQDWRIDVAYVPNLTNRAGYPVHGLCSHLVDAKVASIQVRDPETPATASDPSVEETLVHELVHLHFAPFSGSSSAEIAAEEQAVWALTEALHGAKTAARRGQIARAMVARAAAGTAPERLAERGMHMDPAIIDAILAMLESDPEAAKSYLQKLKGSSEEAAAPIPPGEQAPPPGAPATEEPKMQATPPAAGDEPKAQKVVTREEFERVQVESIVHQHGAKLDDKQRAFALSLSPTQVRAYIATQTSGAAAPASSTAAAERSQASNVVSRVEFERFRVDQLLTAHGAHLNDAQRKFAAGLSFDQVRSYLAQHPATGAAPTVRNQVPTKGGATGDRPGGTPTEDEERAAMRRRLGVQVDESPIRKAGNVLQLGAMTRAQAVAHRERAAKAQVSK